MEAAADQKCIARQNKLKSIMIEGEQRQQAEAEATGRGRGRADRHTLYTHTLTSVGECFVKHQHFDRHTNPLEIRFI